MDTNLLIRSRFYLSKRGSFIDIFNYALCNAKCEENRDKKIVLRQIFQQLGPDCLLVCIP